MNYFENIEIFDAISLEDQIELSDFCQLQHIKAGDTLFQEGDLPQALYVIVEGAIQIKKEVNGENKDVAILEAGDMVGEMAFYGEPPRRNASAIAEKDSTLIVMLFFALNQIIGKNPKLHLKLQEIITDRMLRNKNI